MNQYRCETCKNRKGVYDIPFCDCWDKKIPITKYGMDLISHIGCSSHSDFQNQSERGSVGRISKAAVAGAPPLAIHNKLIRQNEREKVLELLRLKYVEFLKHPCPELADKYKHCCDVDWCGLCTLDEVLAELRQAGEP